MKQAQWEGENVKYKDRTLLTACEKQSVTALSHFTWQQFMLNTLNRKNISTIFTSSTMSACVLCILGWLQLNGKEELKVKRRLHLHLILHHMCEDLSDRSGSHIYIHYSVAPIVLVPNRSGCNAHLFCHLSRRNVNNKSLYFHQK